MKNIMFTLKAMALAIAFSTLIYSCDETPETPDALGTEESKDQLDASMTSVAVDLESVTTMKSADVAESMMNMDMDAPPFEDILTPMANGNRTSMEDMEEAMKAGMVTLVLSDQIDWGTFSYDFSTESFTFVSGDEGTLIINSPSSEEMTSNDIELKVVVVFKDDVNYDAIMNLPYEESIEYESNGYYYWENMEYQFDLMLKEVVTSVSLSLKQDNDMLIGYDISIGLDADDMPNMMEMALTVEEFQMSTKFEAQDRTKGVSHNSSFKKDGNELIGYTLAFNGDISDERIEELTEEVEAIDESDELPSDEFLASLDYNAEAELRFGDFVINGLVDANKIYDAYDNFPGDIEEFEDDNMEDTQYIVDEMNKAILLTLKTKDGASVGKVEFYLTDYDYEDYDYETQNYVMMTGYEPMIRFKFADGTYMSPEDENAESELEGMFSEFIDAMEALSEDLEAMTDRFDDNADEMEY